MSEAFRFNWADLRNVCIHAAIVAGVLVLIGMLGMVDPSALGPSGVGASTALAAVIVALKRYVQDNTIF